MIRRIATRTILLASLALAAPVLAVAQVAAPVIDPADPGGHLPPSGVSLFDQLFADNRGGHAVPFPFESLLARLDVQLRRDPASPLPP